MGRKYSRRASEHQGSTSVIDDFPRDLPLASDVGSGDWIVEMALLEDLFSGPLNRSDVAMVTRFSEDVLPVTDLKVNPGRVIKHAVDTKRPVLLTSRGRGVAVMQSLADYESANEEREFMRAVVAGLADLDADEDVSLAAAKARLGLK